MQLDLKNWITLVQCATFSKCNDSSNHIIILGMAKGEYNVSDKNKEAENGNAIQDRVETINNDVDTMPDTYVGYGFKKDESVNIKFNLPLIGMNTNNSNKNALIQKLVSFWRSTTVQSHRFRLLHCIDMGIRGHLHRLQGKRTIHSLERFHRGQIHLALHWQSRLMGGVCHHFVL